jgi:hypothetical protein
LLVEPELPEDPDRQRVLRPEVKTVTTTSSKDSANASSAPEISAVITEGSVT